MPDPMNATIDTIRSATNRLHGQVVRTPLFHSQPLSHQTGLEVLLKLENLQHTGSFKARGALNKLLSLEHTSRQRGVITASSGNHGAAIAWATQMLNIPARVFVPKAASRTKVDKIRSFGATVEFFGVDGLDTEQHARMEALREEKVYVSPYNDVEVLAGQGTVGVELLEQAASLDAVFIAVGGGGLIGGSALWIKRHSPSTRVFGALPANSPVMAESVRAGRILEMETKPTLSDGTAGGIEAGSITFDLCRDLVDDWILISEAEIERTQNEFRTAHAMEIEGAAAVAVAALHSRSAELKGKQACVVICGGNVSG